MVDREALPGWSAERAAAETNDYAPLTSADWKRINSPSASQQPLLATVATPRQSIAAPPRKSRFGTTELALMVLFPLALIGAGAIGYLIASGGGDSDTPDVSGQGLTSSVAGENAGSARDDSSAEQSSVVPGSAGSPELAFSLEDFAFTLSGTVPDQGSADAIETAVTNTYGRHGTTDLSVNPGIASAPWVERMPFVIQNFTRILDGSLTIDEDGVELDGRSPNEDSIGVLLDALSSEAGFPPVTTNVEVVSLQAPVIQAFGNGDQISLKGILPSQTLKNAIVGDVEELYGSGNVAEEIEIDPETFARFNMIRFASNVKVFKPGGTFEIGAQKGSFYAILDEAITFDVASAELNEVAVAVLEGMPSLLNRGTLVLTVVGHADDVGSAAENLALSEDRANAVADFLIGLGVDSERLVAIGVGETESRISNETDEGQAKNRRVVLSMGFDQTDRPDKG